MERELWNSKAEFILSTVGYSVGYGNVWRFPYVCYANGGGAFLIPYFIILAIGVLPVMILESSIGQFTSSGCISCWKISPIFKGIGFGMVIITGFCSTYFPIMIAYTIRYIVASCYNPLPWVGCNNTWNTPNCFDRLTSPFANDIGGTDDEYLNSSIRTTDTAITTKSSWTANSSAEYITGPVVANASAVRATEEYWRYVVLQISDGLHDMGNINWQLLLCYLLGWVIVYLCLFKGIKSSGKAVYFTATFPYIVLVIILVRGLTLPGSTDGIAHYIKPKWKELFTSKVWKAAANQVFFSFGAGWGGVLTLTSYNKFNNNCYRDVVFISMCCAFSSIFAGFVIFSIIGFMAYDSNLPIEDVVAAGPGLAFVTYPEALSRLVLPQLWSFLFFFMLLTVGLDTQFVMVETFCTAIIDEIALHHPAVRRYKTLIILASCILLLLLGLSMITQGGIYLLTLLDWYIAGSAMLLAFVELLVVSYIYGASRLMKDIRSMIGFSISRYWMFCWMIVAPIIITGIIVFSFVDYTAASMEYYTFPSWAEAIGWTLSMSPIVVVILYATIFLYQQDGPLVKRLKISVLPTPDWGPALNSNRVLAGYPILPNQDGVSDDISEKTAHHPKQMVYIPLNTTDDGGTLKMTLNEPDPV